jgi:hypothetical protein
MHANFLRESHIAKRMPGRLPAKCRAANFMKRNAGV